MIAYDSLNSERLAFLMGGGLMIGMIVVFVAIGVAVGALRKRWQR